MNDWTVDPDTGRSNSSPAFEALVLAVDQMIRSQAHTLLNGDSEVVARYIVAQLAHEYGLTPTEDNET